MSGNAVSYFEIQVRDPDAAMAFYSAVFGWRFQRLAEAPVPYWRIETDGIHGGLLERPAETPPAECGTNAYVCSMEVDSFDVVADRIESMGGQVALPKFAVPGHCWQGYFVDPEGNTFGLFEPDESAG